MAATATTTRRARWERAFKKYTERNQQLSHAQAQDRDALERALAAQQDELLELPSPSFTAVIRKLEILWEGELDGLDRTSDEKRLILTDVQDLVAATAEILG